MADPFAAAERLMAMDDAAWRRHANPWSVWTRFTCGPLLVLALWSRAWLGWGCLVPVAAAALWTWLNPRVFPPVTRVDNWASKGVLGERLLLDRDRRPIPAHHRRAATVLATLSALGLVPLAFGLIALEPWATAAGTLAVCLPKVWFVDRMVWLYEEVAAAEARP